MPQDVARGAKDEIKGGGALEIKGGRRVRQSGTVRK
eukprot:CAMPEP_0173188498 /NCGR_PEP_ID=MMETSP1141-20130122/11287_1 /TAXON_ID=483371 /ORGANISM="non described non described, Strain CCMP2298" /LENGTH=35 /DNA_ID= /DNA_START= /DNA_END= /DNA_ORIENTATION=